jgi:hypothetical protein
MNHMFVEYSHKKVHFCLFHVSHDSVLLQITIVKKNSPASRCTLQYNDDDDKFFYEWKSIKP